jgi:hypothetical protein
MGRFAEAAIDHRLPTTENKRQFSVSVCSE